MGTNRSVPQMRVDAHPGRPESPPPKHVEEGAGSAFARSKGAKLTGMGNELAELRREAELLSEQMKELPEGSIKMLQAQARYKQLAIQIQSLQRAEQS